MKWRWPHTVAITIGLLVAVAAIFWPAEPAVRAESTGTDEDLTPAVPAETPDPDPPSVRYDLESARTIEGTMVSNIVAPSGSILFLQVPDSAGDLHLWAVEGDSRDAHREAGWDLRRTIGIGDTVRVRVHPARPETTIEDVLTATAALSTALATTSEELAFGTEIILPDGGTFPLGAVRREP